MKKFLSLLLALTLVLSLVVVPARANYTENATGSITVSASKRAANEGDEIQFSVSNPSISFNGQNYTATITSYKWNNDNSQNGETYTTTAGSSNLTASCTVELSYTIPASGEGEGAVAAQTITASATNSATVTVTSKSSILRNAITSISYNGRPATISNDRQSVTYYTLTNDSSSEGWKASATGFTEVTASLNNTTLTVQGKNSDSQQISTTFAASAVAASVTLSNPTNPIISKNATGCGTTSITATCNGFTAQSYTWYDGENVISNATSATLNWTPAVTATDGNHTIKCVVKYGSADNQKIDSDTKTVAIENRTYDIRATASPTTLTLDYIVASNNQAASFPAISLYDVTTPAAPVAVSPAVSFTYSKVSDPSNAINLTTSNGTFTVTGNGTATLRATTTYHGKTYTKDVGVYASALMADFDRQVWYNNPGTYYYSDLVTAANKALSAANTYGVSYGTVFTIQSVVVNNNSLGTSTNTLSSGAQSGAISFTAYSSARGKAPVTVRLTTTTSRSVTVTLNIPVVPIPTTFDSLTAEPVTTNYTTSINNYRITFPSTYSTYYVVQKNGTTAPDYAAANILSNQAYSAGSQYTLSSADFGTNGTCTLYVIATNNYTYGSSYGMYYSGAITVSQTNYNINYNGVAGETVQFKHADFTNFMNEVSQARGDASKTGSYPYVTFNYVTFNYPTSTQGTLYYNGTAMSNSSYSGSFNSRTQITNLDNVTFVPYARTSAKSIPLTFTLSVTKYGANGAVVNRDLKYTGTVVVSIVREDIKYTAAPGDTIRFTDSDFLNYLRTQNGFNSNYYSIDYVTFDQSAVNALNEGVLYAYSTGFNAVKTTDKFYYTTTSYNQNALSDVTFRASAYAKTGTTVYIPFTIYARYGTTGTGTRQVSGTVAIKIAQTMNFVDVKPTDYFYDSVKWAVNSNITKGTSATTFSPYKTCTRAEIVTFLWRAAGSKTPTITRNPFTDVAPSMGMDYYYAILWASQNGIAAGTSATTFSPNATCTRAQIVTFLWRYSNKPAGYYSNPFTDVNKAEHAAYYDAILWAVGKGITKGTTATTFSPYGTCTRGEAVTFLYRAVNGK